MFSIRRWGNRLLNLLFSAPATFSLAAACIFFFWVVRTSERVFFIQGWSFGKLLEMVFAMNGGLMADGFYWQPLTYMFFHGGWGHLLLNMLALVTVGVALERTIGPKRILRLFFIGGVIGGLVWLLFAWLQPMMPSMTWLTSWIPEEAIRILQTTFGIRIGVEPVAFNQASCVGASGAVFSLLGAFVARFPYRKIYGIFILIPFKMKARTLAIILVIGTLADAVLVQSQVAYTAHLAGGLVGYLMMRWTLHRRGNPRKSISGEVENDRLNSGS